MKKKLVEEGNDKAITALTPNTEEASKFINFINMKLALKDLLEVIEKLKSKE
ncbi:MAG: hypothetical protein QXG86_02895 [Candidatus Woesearchaeota archaeon]